MNIIQQSDNLKGLSDQQLLQASHDPAGTPPYLIMAEMERRKQMRSDFQAQQARQQGGQPTVASQLQQTLAQPMQQPGQGQQGQPGQMTPQAPGSAPGGLAGLPPPPKLMKRGGRFFAGGTNEDDTTPESMYDGPGESDTQGGISGLAPTPAGDGASAVPIAFPQYGVAGAAESKGLPKRLSEQLREDIPEKPQLAEYIKMLNEAIGGHGDYTEQQRLLARQLAHVNQQNPRLGDYLIRAGLGMAASKSPFFSVAAGEGGLAALNYADKQREQKFNDTNNILQQQMALSRLQQGDRSKLGMEALGMMRADTSERNAQLRGANTQAWHELNADEQDKKLAQQAALSTARSPMLNLQEINTSIDKMLPPTKSPFYAEQNMIAKTQAERIIQMGGDPKDVLKEVHKVIDGSVNRISDLNKGVESAKQIAPTKISIFNAEQQGRNANVASGSDGLDTMAIQYLNTGQFPSRNAAQQKLIVDRAAQMNKEAGMTPQQWVANKNEAVANNAAYKAVVKQYETLKPFADMAEKNAAVLEQASKGVNDLGSSLLNMPVRYVASRFGGEKTAAFIAAIQPVQADFARILNSPTGAGVLSDHARREMQRAIDPNATVGQIKAALDIFRQDANNRKASYNEAITKLKAASVMGGSPAESPAPTGNVRRWDPVKGELSK